MAGGDGWKEVLRSGIQSHSSLQRVADWGAFGDMALVIDVRALMSAMGRRLGEEDSDTGYMAITATQLVQEPLSDHPEVLQKGPGSFAGWGRRQRNMKYNHHGDPYLCPQARETLNKVGICLQSVRHTVGAQQMASLNPTLMKLPKQASAKSPFS